MRIKFSTLCPAVFCLTLSVSPIWAQKNFSLQKALQVARQNNLSLKTEKLNENIAQSDIVTARLRPNPSLNNQTLQLVQSNHFPVGTPWHSGQNRQVWWQLTKVFQPPTQRQIKIDFAQQSLKFTQKNYAEAERNVFQDVANKWLDVWTAQKQLDIIFIAKNNIDSLVGINKVRLKNQVITSTDVMRTELLASQYGIQYKSAKQQLAAVQKEFNFLLGIQDSVGVDTADVFNFAFSAEMDTLLYEALNNRSDIQTLKTGIELATTNIRLQKIQAWPQPEIGFVWNPQNAVQYVGIFATIDLPIFSRNQGEIKKSAFIKQQVEQQLYTVESKVQTEIRTAYSYYRLQQQNVESYRIILKNSQSILDNVRYSYLKGSTTIIDFLEAQRSWLETQQQYYNALLQYRQSYIQLLYTTGLINQLAQ
jgi:cobalt-zinc-cadmium efflux system outer membrane protein